MPAALITGITGQDGSYLAELLLGKGYRVAGLARSAEVEGREHIAHLLDRLELVAGDLRDQASLERALDLVQPDEVYNLAAQTVVTRSWEDPAASADVTALGAIRLLDAVRRVHPEARVFQASSSEIFGAPPASPQDEATPVAPRTPYGLAKAYAHGAVRVYRERYGLFAVAGILYNHESPRRGREFVVRKVTEGVARIAAGRARELVLGDLEARRDWGYAGDYVEAMWLALQHQEPGDYVVGSGRPRSVRELCEVAFGVVGLDWRAHVVRDERLVRAVDSRELVADAAKARRVLGWAPRVAFEQMIEMMVRADLARLSRPEAEPHDAPSH